MRAKRVDKNQPEIVDALRTAGASVHLLHDQGRGCPDLLVGIYGRNLLIEVKSEDGDLNELQKKWHGEWKGQVITVRTVQHALEAIGRE